MRAARNILVVSVLRRFEPIRSRPANSLLLKDFSPLREYFSNHWGFHAGKDYNCVISTDGRLA
jgi:hypothetical protein